MERTLSPTSGGHKVSQIANRFQGSSGSSNCSSGDDATPKRQCDPKSRNPQQADSVSPLPATGSPKEGGTPVVRTESHAARFNNARALFEKLGVESRLVSRPAAINGKMSRDTAVGGGGVGGDSKTDSSPDKLSNGLRNGSTSTNGTSLPPQQQHNGRVMDSNVTPVVGGGGSSGAKIFNVSRPKPEKPEKPERKFNSRELIEKQKNWTSHFSKARTSPRFNSDPNRCDIIRTVPGTQALIKKGTGSPSNDSVPHPTCPPPPPPPVVVEASPPVPLRQHVSFDSAVMVTSHSSRNGEKQQQPEEDSEDIPPCPPIRQNSIPEIRPRSIKPVIVGATAVVNGSPVKIMVKKSPDASPEKMKAEYNSWTDLEMQQQQTLKKDEDYPEKPRKKSFDLIAEENGAGLGRSRSQSLDKENVISPGIGLSSSSSPMASISSEPTSPIHTEDEKQENEANEKTDLGLMTPTDGIDKSEGTDSGEFMVIMITSVVVG